jgi:acetyltransferase-like isoleucine patch superfamily enzyme
MKIFAKSMYRLLLAIIWNIGYFFLPWAFGRQWLLRLYATRVGSNVDYQRALVIFGSRNVYIGNNVKLHDVLINATRRVDIGDDVFFAHRVMLITGGHDFHRFGKDRQVAINGAPIIVGKGVWVGSGAIILGGVTIGEHAVVGAGSVVTKDIPPYSVAAGVPARVLKDIKPVSE